MSSCHNQNIPNSIRVDSCLFGFHFLLGASYPKVIVWKKIIDNYATFKLILNSKSFPLGLKKKINILVIMLKKVKFLK